jgi:hypothetical protein
MRRTAGQQYQSILEDFNSSLHAQEVAAEIRDMVRGPLAGSLDDAQHDVFQSGYGIPLSEAAEQSLRDIADDVVTKTRELTAEFGGGALPPERIGDVARIGRQGQLAVAEFLREHERAAATSDAGREALAQWLRENQQLSDRINSDFRRAEQAQVTAVLDGMRARSAQTAQEDDPERVAATAASRDAEVARSAERAFVAESSANTVATVILINVALILAAGVYLFVRKSSR